MTETALHMESCQLLCMGLPLLCVLTVAYKASSTQKQVGMHLLSTPPCPPPLSSTNVYKRFSVTLLQILQLEMERLSLAKAVSDRASKQRLQALDGQLKKLKGEQAELTKQWRGEKDDMERLQSVKEEIDRVNLEIQGAERDYDLNRAAELKYGTLMDLQKQLKGAEVALEKQVGTVCSLLFLFAYKDDLLHLWEYQICLKVTSYNQLLLLMQSFDWQTM